MKNILNISFLLWSALLLAQDNNQNFIKNTTYKVKTTSSINSPTETQAAQSIMYLDGIGRPVQQRAYKQSSTGKDIVTYIEYDAIGRQTKEYLPYPTTSASLAFDPNAENATRAYYSNPAPPAMPSHETTLYPYSEKFFEASPLDRVLKESSEGDPWKGNATNDNDRTIKTEFLANTAADNVEIILAEATWDASSGLYMPSFSKNGIYSEGDLYKTIVKDEDWTPSSGNNHTVQEFTNKKGQVVLKRIFGTSMVNGTEVGLWHDTYYIYDQFGNLSFVLPPLSNRSGSLQDLNEICYQYRYDHRRRLAEKKMPGRNWEFTIYDNLDRVIATGPAQSPFSNFSAPDNKGWFFTKYDVYGRTVYTGWMQTTSVTSADRANFQSARNAQTTNLHEKKLAGSNNTVVNGVSFRYTNQAWPTGTGWHVLAINYYDDYNFPNAPSSFGTVEGQEVRYNLTLKPKGLQTGSWLRVLETSAIANGELSYTLYDYKARPIRKWTSNYIGGYTQIDNSLDFSGKILYSITKHKRTASANELVIREDLTYSNQDKVLSQSHKIGSNPAELLAKNEYDELGQLIVKRVGGTDLTGNNPHQKIDYSYNIRGWLTGINSIDNFEVETINNKDLFAFGISYNDVSKSPDSGLNPIYNGNITETRWKSRSDSRERSYSFRYDSMERLKSASYFKERRATKSYDEWMDYDKNGNILHLNRYGDLDYDIFAIEIDDLDYTYDAGNKLRKVKDNSIHPAGFKDGADLIDEYRYDSFGNMIGDENKGISLITYNHMNLPLEITFSAGGKINYLYDASGNKQKKTITQGTSVTTTDYLSGFQYISGVLDLFPTVEGYVKCMPAGGSRPATYSYVYNYLDHLGNIRMSYGMDPKEGKLVILEENHYYPFGMKHEKYNSDKYEYVLNDKGDQSFPVGISPVEPTSRKTYQYKYNGQEFQDELGLNFYDYGARNYDPAIGRWMNLDPLAEKSRRWSPYVYAFNSPVYFIDPDGMWPDGIGDWLKKYAKSAWSTGTNMVVGVVTSTYTSGKNAVTEIPKVAEAFEKGGLSGAAEQYKESVLETSGANAAVEAVQKATSGDPEAIAAVVVNVTAVVMTHKVAKGSHASKTKTTAAKTTAAEKTATATTKKAVKGVETLKPGKFAGESIPARGKGRNFTKAERASINKIGQETGCHTCGTKVAGTKSGNFILDHQPVSGLVPDGTGQSLFPHCSSCSAKQGGTVSSILRKKSNVKEE